MSHHQFLVKWVFVLFCFMSAPTAYGSPQPRVELELQLPAYATATATAIPVGAVSVTYTMAHSNAGSLTHQEKPGIKPATSQTLCQAFKLLSHNGNFPFSSSSSFFLTQHFRLALFLLPSQPSTLPVLQMQESWLCWEKVLERNAVTTWNGTQLRALSFVLFTLPWGCLRLRTTPNLCPSPSFLWNQFPSGDDI